MTYWIDRQQRMQQRIADKTINDINKQLIKYYKSSMKQVINDFEATYDKLIATVGKGKEPTPADLYKLHRFWEQQSQLKRELTKLGDKEAALLSKHFEEEWISIYNKTHIPTDTAFHIIDVTSAKEMIDKVWLPDGLTYSQRLWKNIDRLAETLNENLIHVVQTGKSTIQLRDLLIDRFNVSINQANTLITTEVAHIQTEAAAKKYQDYGLEKYRFFADSDDKTCKHNHDGKKSCHELDGEVFYFKDMKTGVNAPPMHPRCRCSITGVVE